MFVIVRGGKWHNEKELKSNIEESTIIEGGRVEKNIGMAELEHIVGRERGRENGKWEHMRRRELRKGNEKIVGVFDNWS